MLYYYAKECVRCIDLKRLETWFRQTITIFREEVSKLTQDQRMKISNLDDLSSPCQVDVFWFQNEQLKMDFQLIIYQHFKDRSDLEICIHGPIPFYKAVDELERILSYEKWGQELASDERYLIEDGERTLRRILEGEFLSALEELRQYTLNLAFSESAKPVMISRKMYVTQESFAWFVWGNICLMEPLEIVNDILGKSIVEAPKPIPKPDNDKRVPKADLKAYGTYFYPSIWIGEIPKRSFKEKAQKQFFPKSREHFIIEYRSSQAIIQQDGLLAIVNESKAKVLDTLNEIMGVALILGLPCYAIREPEVGEIKIDGETLAIKSSTMSLVSDRTRQVSQLGEPSYMSMMIPTTFLLSKENIIDLFNRANRITRDDEIKKSLPFLLESYTHLQSSEYAQCFVMGWTVIEGNIVFVWENFLKDKSIASKRRQKLKQGLLWTTDTILETLNLAGAIDSQNYNRIMGLKNRRNKIIHGGETATKEDADQCFKVAMALVQASVQNLGELQLINPQRRILGIRN